MRQAAIVSRINCDRHSHCVVKRAETKRKSISVPLKLTIMMKTRIKAWKLFTSAFVFPMKSDVVEIPPKKQAEPNNAIVVGPIPSHLPRECEAVRAEFSLFNPSPDCQIRFLNLMLHLLRGWSYDWCLRFGAPKTLHECEHSKQTGMKNDDRESAWLHPTTLGFPFRKFRKMCRVAWDGQKFNSLNYCCRKWSVGERCRMELEKVLKRFSRVHKQPPQTTRCYTPASTKTPKTLF